jgi:glutamyl-tRNA(Gln) amidotransferase subunit E
MSIRNGARTEIKGFQDLKSIPKAIEKEVERQLRILKQGKKIQQEVRKAEPDFTTSFLRPMPGAARMYPETDVPPIRITKHRLNKVKIPELLSERIVKLEKAYNLNPNLARELIKQKVNFKKYTEQFTKIEPNYLAHILIELPKEIKARYNLNPDKIKPKDMNMVLEHLNTGKITKAAVLELFLDILNGKKLNLNKYKTASTNDLEKEIKAIVKQKPNLTIGAYMGIIMSKYKGKVDGKEVMKVLKKLV